MKKSEEILNIVRNQRIDDDAWSDVLKYNAIDLLETIEEKSELDILFNSISELDRLPQSRLIEVLLSVPEENRFLFYLKLINHNDVGLSEIIFDNLRTWNLNSDQSAALIEAYIPFKGQSKLLDYVMEDFIKKQNV